MEWIELLQQASAWVFDGAPLLAIFGIGGSKSKSASEAASDSSSSSFSQTRARNNSLSGGSSQTTSEVAFGDSFARLFAGAEDAAAAIDPSRIAQAADELFSSGTSFLDQLSEGGVGREALAERITDGGRIANRRIRQLGGDLGRFFREELLTGISRGSTGANTVGGSRQGVAESLAAREVAQQFQRGATDIRSRELSERTDAAAQLAGFELAGDQAAIGALPGLLELQETGALSELAPSAALSQILGGPTVLSQSESEQFGRSSGFNFSLSKSGSKSSSRAYSKGKSGGLNIAFG